MCHHSKINIFIFINFFYLCHTLSQNILPGLFLIPIFSSTDDAATVTFMTKLLGWTVKDMPMGADSKASGMYHSFYLDGKAVAGGMKMPADMIKKGVPSMWNSYVTVDNVDETVKKALELGAKVAMPAMDVFDICRMAAIMDPTGAPVMLYQPKKSIGAEIVNTIGAMGWNELYTKDVEKAKDFYSKLFGWTYDVDKDSGYVMIQNKGRANGGIFAITPEMGDMPPMWVVYFTVKDMDASLAKVKDLGGKVHMGPKKIGPGKIAMIADPAGASFIIIELSPDMPPEEWVE